MKTEIKKINGLYYVILKCKCGYKGKMLIGKKNTGLCGFKILCPQVGCN